MFKKSKVFEKIKSVRKNQKCLKKIKIQQYKKKTKVNNQSEQVNKRTSKQVNNEFEIEQQKQTK